MRAEVLAHGLRFLDKDTMRANNLVQQAVEEVVNKHDWPFRETNELAYHGIAVVGLGAVQQVVTERGAYLVPRRRDELSEWGDTGVGTPHSYYMWRQDTLYLYPESDEAVACYHYSKLCWTENGERVQTATDDDAVCVIPSEFLDVPVLLALERAKRLAGNPEEAGTFRETFDIRLDDMRAALIERQVDEVQRIRPYGEWA